MPICHRSTDDRALRHRVVDTLKEFPDGASTAQLAAVMGDAQATISGIVSKMHVYGGPIDKIGDGGSGPKIRWRLRQLQDA